MSGDAAASMGASDELQWLEGLRQRAYEYLDRLGLWQLRIDDMPSWHMAPYLCIWTALNEKSPAWGEWWVICGNLPTDCIRADMVRSPRDAMHAIGARWLEAARCMKAGEARPATWTGLEESCPEVAILLENRGGFLVSWAEDDDCWGIEYAP